MQSRYRDFASKLQILDSSFEVLMIGRAGWQRPPAVWHLCAAGGAQPGGVLRQLGRVQRRVQALFVVRPVARAVAQDDVVVLQSSSPASDTDTLLISLMLDGPLRALASRGVWAKHASHSIIACNKCSASPDSCRHGQSRNPKLLNPHNTCSSSRPLQMQQKMSLMCSSPLAS
jgi:hypothetical protein